MKYSCGVNVLFKYTKITLLNFNNYVVIYVIKYYNNLKLLFSLHQMDVQVKSNMELLFVIWMLCYVNVHSHTQQRLFFRISIIML